MAEKNSDEMRYGISALSMEYREEATNDEILLDPQTGKPYYKREEDGQIVSFDDLSYSQNELPLAMNTAIMNQSLSVTTTSTDFVVYNTIDVAGKIDLFNNEDNVLTINNAFENSSVEATMYFRIHGDIITNAIMSYLDELHNKKMNELPEEDRKSLIEVTFTITTGLSSEDITVGCKFNTLVALPLLSYGDGIYKVKIKSIKSNLTNEIFDELPLNTKRLIKSFNNDNTKLEITEIDIISYVTDITKSHLYDDNGVKLKYILPMSVVENAGSSSEGIILSENKPNHKCIWGKILR